MFELTHASQSLHDPPPRLGKLPPAETQDFLDERTKTAISLKAPGDHYEQIGLSLCIAESRSWHVGVPWLPPTAKVKKLQAQCDGSLEQHIRYSLAGVPTASIISYADDLEREPLESRSLNLLPITFVERNAFALLLGVVAGALPLLFGGWLSLPPVFFITAAVLSLLSAVALGILLASDSYRRITFVQVLRLEIARRSGNDAGPGSKLRVCEITEGV